MHVMTIPHSSAWRERQFETGSMLVLASHYKDLLEPGSERKLALMEWTNLESERDARYVHSLKLIKGEQISRPHDVVPPFMCTSSPCVQRRFACDAYLMFELSPVIS